MLKKKLYSPSELQHAQIHILVWSLISVLRRVSGETSLFLSDHLVLWHFPSNALWHREHWTHGFISWPMRLAMRFHFFNTSCYHKYQFTYVCVSAEKFGEIYVTIIFFKLNTYKKVSLCLLHMSCGITRWCARRSDEQCVFFFCEIAERFQTWQAEKACCCVLSVKCWNIMEELKNLTHSMGRQYMQILHI